MIMKNTFLTHIILILFAVLLIACSGGQKRNGRGGNNSGNGQEEVYTGENSNETRKPSSNSSEPDEQKIKYDLAGRTIVEPTKELHRSKFQIHSSNNVQKVEILDKEKNGNQIFYRTQLKLNDGINTYLADVNITYTKSNQEWGIQHLESKFLDIVPTKQFDNCIVITKDDWYQRYELHNNCDVALLVEGRHIGYFYSTHWSYFAEMIPANGKKNFIGTYADYKIERIERP
jgi:hypothetical protein